MVRKNLTFLAVGAVTAVAMLAVHVSEAQAFRHWSASSSSGSWGSSSSSSGSWGSSSSGSSGGWLARHRAYKAHRRYARWNSSGSWGSRSSGSWGSSSSGSSGSSGNWVPATPEAPAGEVGEPSARYRSNSGTLTVSVPADAKVFVNDAATRSEGPNRRYVSRGLASGRSYTYTVRVEFERDGETVTETKTARLTAGGNADLSFDGAASDDEQVAETPVDTKLTLNVPADAKVFLAGNETRLTGAERTYTTKNLKAGQTWDGYKIRVAIERDGQVLDQERTIKLVAGESQELLFDFDMDKLANAAR